MKLKRVKGGKGQRWKKGHSCVSNPENTSHRNAAKGNFFQKLDGESGLTVEALAKHTAALAVGTKLSADPEDDRSVGKTFNTFVTNVTTCTIPAFEKFLKSFSMESELQTHMLAIHATAQEYIQNAKLKESSTSYMCALMVSLEGVKDSEDDVTATLSLLAKVIRKASKEVLKVKFGEYSKLFDDVFTRFCGTSNSKLLIKVIGCLSILLRAQDEIQWTYSYTKNLFQKLITFSTHQDADVRRAAHYNASAILKGSSFMASDENYSTTRQGKEKEGAAKKKEEMEVEEDTYKAGAPFVFRIHPVADSCGKFIITSMKLASENTDGKATLYLLNFLQQIITCLPKKTLEQCCELVLGVMHIGDDVVNNRVLKVFGALFSAEVNEVPMSSLTTETNEAIINALTSLGDAKHSLQLVPSMNNCDLSTIWMDVVASGIVHLTRLKTSSGIDQLSLWMKQLSSFWKSDFEVVHEKVWHVIDFLFDECVKPLKEHLSAHIQPLVMAFHQIEKCLSLQFESAWPYVFSSLVPFFGVVGIHASSEMIPCLKNLSSLANTRDLKGKRQQESAVGAAISSMGSEEVLKVVPLQITGDIREDETHFWILPILKKYVKNTRLCFFKSYFVHLAEKCRILLDKLKEQGKLDSMLGKTYQVIERQIWALFPSYTDGAVDVEEALTKDFVVLIRDHIKIREDTRIDVMAALRNMLAVSPRTSGLAMYHGKELLPALFGIYLMKPRDRFPDGFGHLLIDPGQRLEALTTIEAFFCILRSDKIPVFFSKLLEKLESETSDAFTHRALLSLSKSFLPYLNASTLDIIYEKAESDAASRDSGLQKAGYKIIKDIFSTNSRECKLYIEKRIDSIITFLLSPPTSVIPSASTPRLQCLMKMLAHLPTDMPEGKREEFLKQVVQEAIKFCGQQNSTPTRKASFALLSEVGKAVQKIMELSYEDTFLQCFALLPPLIPPSDVSANTVLALMAMFHQYKDLLSPSTLGRTMEDVSSLLSHNNRSVLRSSLGFIRMMFAFFPSSVMSEYVDIAVRRMIEIPAGERKKLRIKIRDIFASLIRKFGADRIKAIVPQEDTIIRMVRNVVKDDRQKKRRRRRRKDNEGEEEEEAKTLTSLDEILAEIDREIENDERESTEDKARLKRKKPLAKKKTWIREDEDEVVDLLDISSGQHITNKKPKIKRLRFEDNPPRTGKEKYGFRIDKKTKKFIITERGNDKEDITDEYEDNDTAVDLPEIILQVDDKAKRQRTSKRKRTASEGSDDTSQPSRKYGAASNGEKRIQMKKNFDYGAEFRSKKARGDVTKKGGVMPYAYVQISKDKLNRRKKAKYAGQFRSLVRGAKKGAVKGTKLKAIRKGTTK